MFFSVLVIVVGVQGSDWLKHLKKRSVHPSAPVEQHFDEVDEEEYFSQKDNWKNRIMSALNEESSHESEVDIANNLEERDFMANVLQRVYKKKAMDRSEV